ncbi:MAG: ribosome biogenesis GTPase Der [Proteobacteria bacterium]|nr:ribosome biogenesis GTPase Der [Pseudomonadota bacterium]
MKIFALVGKPNVGKSTLFNRLAKKRLAIVDEQPGVTRDRNMAVIDTKGYKFILIDTGGFEPESKEAIPRKMKEQSQLAVEEADGIVFLLDGRSGWTPQDQGIYDYLRRSEKPLYFTINKIDGDKQEQGTAEFYESGTSEIFPVSAEHGRGVTGLLEAMARDFPEISDNSKTDDGDDSIIAVSIVGRPNAGKSSLVNHFLGKTKQIVHEKPGTTRDPVDNYCKYHGQSIRLIDTAGIRRKSRVSLVVDKYSMIAALKSIERSDVVLLTIDATEGVVEQDARIAGYIVERGKSLVLVINKWDLVIKDNQTMDTMKQEIRDKLKFVDFAPMVFVSAKTGQRIPTILEKVLQVYREYSKRVQTSDLNNILQSIVARHTPPLTGRKVTKFYYTTQVATRPPSFIITSNFPDSINLSYRRFVTSQFRYFFGFEGTPIRIFWRDKSLKKTRKVSS